MGKGSGSSHTPTEDRDNLKSRQLLKQVHILGEGEIEGFENGLQDILLDDTPILGSDGTANFSGVYVNWNLGTQNQLPLDGFNFLENEVAVNTAVTNDTPIIRTITDPNVDQVRVTLSVPALYYNNTDGDMVRTNLHCVVEVFEGGEWIQKDEMNLRSKKTTSEYRHNLLVTELPDVPFSVRVRRLTADSSSSRMANDSNWSSYTEIINEKLSYPNTAVVGLSFYSDQFSSIPTVKFKPKGRIVRVPSNYDPETRVYNGLWDGSFKTAWTDNPAWVFLDLCTCARAGLGRRLSVNDVDKWWLYQVSKYCDQLVDDGRGGQEPRFTFHAYISDQADAYTVLSDLAAVIHAMPVWDGEQMGLRMDMPSDPVCRYTNANVIDGEFVYQSTSKDSRYTAAQVKYFNVDELDEDYVYVSDDEAITRFGYNFQKLDTFGCQSAAQATRVGRWMIYTSLREVHTVQFSVGPEGLRHLPGDIIETADNDYAGVNIGGRVLAVDGHLITLDRDIEYSEGLEFTYRNDDLEEVTVPVESKVAEGIIRLPSLPVDLSRMAMWTISSSNLVLRRWRCVKVEEDDDGAFSISAVQHVATKYEEIESGIKIEALPESLRSSAIPTPESLVVNDDDIGQVTITWVSPTVKADISYVVTLYRSEAVVIRKTVTNLEASFSDLELGDYVVSVQGRNSNGKRGSEGTTSFSIAVPTAPTGIKFTPDFNFIGATPIVAAQSLGTTYEWYWGATQDAVVAKENYLGRGSSMTHNTLSPDTVYWYGVQAINAVGRSSLVVAQTKTTIDAAAILTVLQGKVSQEQLDEGLTGTLQQLDSRASASASAIDELDNNLLGAIEGIEEIDISLKGALTNIEHLDLNFADMGKSLSNVEFHVMQVQQLSNDLAYNVMTLASDAVSSQAEYERRLLAGETMIGAVVTVDEETGQIVNLAYNYADQKFTQAGLLIDGVAASVKIQAQEVSRVETEVGERVTNAESQITVLSDRISQKASYNEVNALVSSAIDAVTPAKSWQFNTSSEGWTGATWNADGTISGSVFSIDGLSIDADSNTVVRIRVKSANAGTFSWNNNAATVAIEASPDAFTTVILTLSASDGWAGTIERLHISMESEIDFIEVGKPSAAELALSDLTSRTTEIEQTLDPVAGVLSNYVTQSYWDANSLKLTDVQQKIDAFSASYGIEATFNQLSDNDTVAKANAAQSWIDTANGTITQAIAAYNAKDGGVNDQLNEQSDSLTQAEERIDALAGTMTDTIASINDVENQLGVNPEDGLNSLLSAFNDFVQQNVQEKQSLTLAYAQRQIEAHTGELKSVAESTLELFAAKERQQALIQVVQQAISEAEQSIASTRDLLRTEFSDADNRQSIALNELINQALTTSDQALAEAKQSLQAEISDGDSVTLQSANTHTDQSVATVNNALAQVKSLLQAEIESSAESTLAAANETTAQASASAGLALADATQTLQSEISDGDSVTLQSANTHTDQSVATVNNALAQTKSNLQTQIDDGDSHTLKAANDRIDKVISDQNEALSESTLRLQSQVNDLAASDDSEGGLNALLQAVSDFEANARQQVNMLTLAYAQDTLSTHTTQLGAQAQSVLELFSAKDRQQSLIRQLQTSVSDVNQALAKLETTLQTQFGDADESLRQALLNQIAQVSSTAEQSLVDVTQTLQSEISDGDAVTLQSANTHTDQSVATVNNALAQTKTTLRTEFSNADNSVLQSANQTTSDAFSSASQALTQAQELLASAINKGDEQTLSEAKAYTRAAVGYCVDRDGNITDETNAVACVAVNGNSWVEGPLAEYIRAMTLTTSDNQSVSVQQLMQAFVTQEGVPIARGALITNTNGKISGMVNTNTGETTSLDLIAQYFRVGDYDADGNFTPTLYVDNESNQMVFRGHLILDDGQVIKSRAELQGTNGTDGMNGTIWGSVVLRNGVFPGNSVANADFESRYGRAPQLDDVLTYSNSDGSVSSTKSFDGSAWIVPVALFNGNVIAKGTVYGDALVAGTEIVAPLIKGGTGSFQGTVEAGKIIGSQSSVATASIGSHDLYGIQFSVPAGTGYWESSYVWDTAATIVIPNARFERRLVVKMDVSNVWDASGKTGGKFDESIKDSSNPAAWPYQTAMISRLLVNATEVPEGYSVESSMGEATFVMMIQAGGDYYYRLANTLIMAMTIPATEAEGSVDYDLQLALRRRAEQTTQSSILTLQGVTVEALSSKVDDENFTINLHS